MWGTARRGISQERVRIDNGCSVPQLRLGRCRVSAVSEYKPVHIFSTNGRAPGGSPAGGSRRGRKLPIIRGVTSYTADVTRRLLNPCAAPTRVSYRIIRAVTFMMLIAGIKCI